MANDETPTTNSINTGFQKILGWTVNAPAVQGCTPDFANDEIVITRQGVWAFSATFSLDNFAKNNAYILTLFHDGVATIFKAFVEVPAGGLDGLTMSLSGLLGVGDPLVSNNNPPPSTIDLRLRRESGSGNFDFIDGTLVIYRVGEGFV